MMDGQKERGEIVLKWEGQRVVWNAICICRAAGGHEWREAGLKITKFPFGLIFYDRNSKKNDLQCRK